MKNWLQEEYTLSNLKVTRIPFNASREWGWNPDGFLKHHTGRFFNVVGVKYYSLNKNDFAYQPIIDQSEIGLLSFLVHKNHDGWWILAHAKVEPGNVNGAQLAPTIQATKSNYEMAHGGGKTPYLDLFQTTANKRYNQLQSEQNCRFLAKRNRNCVVQLDNKVHEKDSRFKWIRIEQLLSLLGYDYCVNSDARSVVTCWLFTDANAMQDCLDTSHPFSKLLVSSVHSTSTFHTDSELEMWRESLNTQWQAKTEIIPLKELGDNWTCNDSEITSIDDPSQMIYHIAVSCEHREVTQWDQPISGSALTSEIILIVGRHENTLHLLVQAKLEAGNRNGFELTTTVQSEMATASDAEKMYLDFSEKDGKALLDIHNSEEGGRFDRCLCRYRIIRANNITDVPESPFHRWISLSQFSGYLKQENIITNELRSAASSLLSIKDL